MPVDTHRNPRTFHWMLANFVRTTDGVRDAVAVSSDGLLIAMSPGLDRGEADHLAAVVSGLVSLCRGAARRYQMDTFDHLLVQMRDGFVLVSSVADGSCVGVLAEGGADAGLVGRELADLTERAGAVLNPGLIEELRDALPRE